MGRGVRDSQATTERRKQHERSDHERQQHGQADTLEATPNLAIPDDVDAGVSDVITVDTTGAVTRLTVTVDITQPRPR